MCSLIRRGCLITSSPEESSSLPRKWTMFRALLCDEIIWSLCDEKSPGPQLTAAVGQKSSCWTHRPQVPSSLALLGWESKQDTLLGWKEDMQCMVKSQSAVYTVSIAHPAEIPVQHRIRGESRCIRKEYWLIPWLNRRLQEIIFLLNHYLSVH